MIVRLGGLRDRRDNADFIYMISPNVEPVLEECGARSRKTAPNWKFPVQVSAGDLSTTYMLLKVIKPVTMRVRRIHTVRAAIRGADGKVEIMRSITDSSMRRRAQRVLLAGGVGLTLALPTAVAQAHSTHRDHRARKVHAAHSARAAHANAEHAASPNTDTSMGDPTCTPANSTGINNSDGVASGSNAQTCPPGQNKPAGGTTGHKVG